MPVVKLLTVVIAKGWVHDHPVVNTAIPKSEVPNMSFVYVPSVTTGRVHVNMCSVVPATGVDDVTLLDWHVSHMGSSMPPL